MATRFSRHPFEPYRRDSELWRAVAKLGYLVLALILVLMLISALIRT
jgi:hypothetical protein